MNDNIFQCGENGIAITLSGLQVSINNKIVLLHGFIKKNNKTPEREKETAKKRMTEYKRRFET